MTDRVLIAGDSYQTRRAVFRYTLLTDTGAAFDLTGCTVRSTFKPALATITDDPTDTTAPIKATLIVSGAGAATTQTKLYLVGAATGGIVELRLSATETAALPLDTTLHGDAEVTDANGEVLTVLLVETVTVASGYTNRTTG